MTTISPHCFSCRHFDQLEALKPEHRYICTAFPEGIPRPIIFNEFKHTKHYKGQLGDLLYDELTWEEENRLHNEAKKKLGMK